MISGATHPCCTQGGPQSCRSAPGRAMPEADPHPGNRMLDDNLYRNEAGGSGCPRRDAPVPRRLVLRSPPWEYRNSQFSSAEKGGAPQTTKLGTQIIGEFRCRGRDEVDFLLLGTSAFGPKAERLLLGFPDAKADGGLKNSERPLPTQSAVPLLLLLLARNRRPLRFRSRFAQKALASAATLRSSCARSSSWRWLDDLEIAPRVRRTGGSRGIAASSG